MQNQIHNYFDAHNLLMVQVAERTIPVLEVVASLVVHCLKSGSKLLVMGNGGSAADAQHLAAELVGRFVAERQALPAIALTTDSSILTAVGNDYGFTAVFQRQVEALARPGDVVIGISTSGNSNNVLNAMTTAKAMGCICVGLLGRDGGEIASVVDHALVVPTEVTAHIQEAHIVLIHLLCQLVDDAFKLVNLSE